MVPERDAAMERALLPLKRDYNQAWHGFDRGQVLQYLDHVETNLRRIMADRDGTAARAAKLARELESANAEILRLRTRVEELKRPPERLEDLDERMMRTVELANARAEEVTERARVAAEEHWTATTELSAKLRERYRKLLNELESHAGALRTEQDNALKATKAEVLKLTTEAARRRTQLDIEAERKRRTMEHEFEQTLAAEKAALEKHIADQKTASKSQAERRIAEATAEATRLLDEARTKARKMLADATAAAERRENDANRRVEVLNSLSGQAYARLRKADEVLARNQAALDPLPAESAVELSSSPQIPSTAQPAAGPAKTVPVKPAAARPAIPAVPAKQATRATPAKPATRATPAQPGTRATPAQPGVPMTPAKPAARNTSAGPGASPAPTKQAMPAKANTPTKQAMPAKPLDKTKPAIPPSSPAPAEQSAERKSGPDSAADSAAASAPTLPAAPIVAPKDAEKSTSDSAKRS
ncbi:cell division protein DivIVA [Amycolatopsis pigmentata]|uniref:Cell division protein DivIVA n=1 Tax=Amycolatopsis pigmentata TaxID=450801 RepID=A0ABW5FY95_9PSEU